jgi:cobalamin biosynthesis protein CobD/CbiB
LEFWLGGGEKNYYLERFIGAIGWQLTPVVFVLSSILICLIPEAHWFVQLPFAVILLSLCFASRSIEEHVMSVEMVLIRGENEGRAKMQKLVSRDVQKLSLEQMRSVAYELAAEN